MRTTGIHPNSNRQHSDAESLFFDQRKASHALRDTAIISQALVDLI